MSSTDELSSLQEYLCSVTSFLADYAWIYQEKNTDIFVCNVLEKIPSEWCEPLSSLPLEELRKVPFNCCKVEFPSSLQTFIHTANKLAEFRYNRKLFVDSDEQIKIPDFLKTNTSAQKLVEIRQLTAVIGELIKKHGFCKIIDIGSGLGYLDQLLHHNFGVSTIGFEIDSQRSCTARGRIQNNCKEGMFHVNSKIENTNECMSLLEEKMQEVSGVTNCGCGKEENSKIWDKFVDKTMMVGLHSCGDLMPDMMKLFSKLSQTHVFLCVSCCYHHVTLRDFPMSSVAKESLRTTRKTHPDWYPSTTGLRMGCQTTRAYYEKLSQEKHYHREKSLFYRAMLQVFLETEKLVWVKPRRHFIRRSDASCFEKFVPYVFQGMPWFGKEKERKMKEFEKLCSDKAHLLPYIRVLNLLQTLLQPLWEGLVLADRLAYFLEKTFKAELFQMCDELVTPRNLMLCAVK